MTLPIINNIPNAILCDIETIYVQFSETNLQIPIIQADGQTRSSSLLIYSPYDMLITCVDLGKNKFGDLVCVMVHESWNNKASLETWIIMIRLLFDFIPIY